VDEKEDNNIQWEEQSAAIKLINISITFLARDNLTIGVIEIHFKYYVNLHIKLYIHEPRNCNRHD
jgi:hypothetical protein